MLSDTAGAYFNKIPCCAPMARQRRGLFWQNLLLRPDVPTTPGLITAKSLSVPRYPDIDGAYYGKILICAPMSCQRRGLLRQNPYLRPDVPVTTGLITAKSLSVPRCTKVVGIIDLICLTYPRLRRPVGIIDLICLTYPRLRRPVGIIDLVLSHIPASTKARGYNRPNFVSHTRFRKFCWVQIACF